MNVVPLAKLENGLPILDRTELVDRAVKLHASGGLPRGQSTGWRGLDELYTVLPGQWTAITGTPGSGKSEWLDALMVNLAEDDDRWQFALYSPENYPPETHLIKLAEKRVRMPFSDGPTQRMSRAQFLDAATWVCTHFDWLEPRLKTPDELIGAGIQSRVETAKFGIVLDPWNTLDHRRGQMSETDYVSFVLTEVTKLCRESKAHVWLVVHPAKIPRNKDGSRPVPTPYDISGSAHWYNKADNVVTVHRDQTEGQEVEIHVQKVRFKHCGRVGLATLRYDKVTGRYFECPGIRGETYADPERR